jgi:DNA-binding IclR family transcriptional regulator
MLRSLLCRSIVFRIVDRLIRDADYIAGVPTSPAPAPPASGIQVLQRAARVLRAVGEQGGGLRPAELAPHVDLAKTTLHRIVTALADERLLRVDPSGRIWLGPGVAALARAGCGDLAEQLRPVLVDLHRAVDETVDLSVLDGASARFVDQIASRHRLRAVSTVGAAFPLHCSANGKAMLAALPVTVADELVPTRLEAFTPHTIVDRGALFAELDAIRVTGVAFDREEHTIGIAAVGVAVRAGDTVLGAISVPAPADRFARTEATLRDAVFSAGRAAGGLLDA